LTCRGEQTNFSENNNPIH